MKIQVWKTAKLTVKDVWQHKLEWARVLFAPWVVLVMGYLVSLLIGVKTGENIFQYEYSILQFSVLFFFGLISKLQMILNGFCYTLLKEDRNRWWTLHFNRRFFKLMLYNIPFTLLMGPVPLCLTSFIRHAITTAGIISTGTPSISTGTPILVDIMAACGILGAIYLITRLSLYSLFIATDQKRPLRSSWHLLKKNVWRFAGFLILFLIPTGMVNAAFALPEYFTMHPPLTTALALIMRFFLTPLMLALFIKGASLVYQTLNEQKGMAKKVQTPRAKKQKALPK